MQRNILRLKLHYLLKNLSVNKIPAFGVILLFMITSVSIAYSSPRPFPKDQSNAIVWDVYLNFNEPGGAYDNVIFGEAPDANDGPPVDSYDTLNPPAPMPPYIRTWFDDNLPYPYNELLKDYRHYPGMNKVWNLSVQWWPQTGSASTTITITWSPTAINLTEYVSITLYTSSGTPLRNMRMFSSYSFVCPAFIPQTFEVICVANQAPYKPSNPSPTNGSLGVLLNADLSWTCCDPNGDSLLYDVFFGTSSTPPKVASNITVPTYDPGTMNPGTLYFWKIVARDDYGGVNTSEKWQFQTNSLPNPPNNPFPSNGSVGNSLDVILSWYCSDPDSNPLTYDVYFGLGSNPPLVSNNQTITAYDPPGLLTNGVTYYWKVVAWDQYTGSRNSPLWNFKTNSLPNIPNSPYPSNGSINVSINILLSWSGGDPDLGDTVLYDVYFGLSSNPPHVSYNQSSLSYYPSGDLQYNTSYYWRIVAWDNHGGMRGGPLWHFTTGLGNQPPNVPYNPFPQNGSTGISVNVDLSWMGGDPDSGDTVTYDVYFGTSNSPPCVIHNQTGLIYDPGTLTPYTYYYWRIVAWDNHDASRGGPHWQFRTEYVNSPPYKPSNPSPANGSTEIPVTTDLCWVGGDPDSGDFVTYDVYFGRSFPLTKIKSNISGTSCTVEDLNYGMKYYWNVTAWDNHHNKNEGPLWSFSTKTDTSSPSLAITQPKERYLYIYLFGGIIQKRFLFLFTTLVIGQIEVIATASDAQSGMNRVEFYLDDELKYTDYTAEDKQYTWLWDERGNVFPYRLRIVAYDNCGRSSNLNLRVWKIF